MTRAILRFLAFAATSLPVDADQADPAANRSAIVMVTASGVNADAGSIAVSVQGTGFFVSANGYLVTAYHLFTKLIAAGVDPRTITYAIQYSSDPAWTTPATQLFSNPSADVMVLFTPVGDRVIKPLAKADRATGGFGLGTAVFTGGFPKGYSFSVDQGVLKNFGPTEAIPAWTVSINFKDGQSGSPIMLADDRVIAIASSTDTAAPSFNLVVPSQLIPAEFWDAASPRAPKQEPKGRVVVDALTAATQPRSRSQPVDFVSPHCAATKQYQLDVKATPGWTVDPDSVSLQVINSFGPNNLIQIKNARPSGFRVTASLSNLGKCLWLAGHPFTFDVGADYHGIVSYVERPLGGTQQWQTITDAQVVDAVSAPIQNIPADKLRVTVVTPHGSIRSSTLGETDIRSDGAVRVLDIAKLAAAVVPAAR